MILWVEKQTTQGSLRRSNLNFIISISVFLQHSIGNEMYRRDEPSISNSKLDSKVESCTPGKESLPN